MVFTEKSDRKLKQNYLRENILEAGYDPEDFCEFLEQLKDGGAEIDVWTFNDLETLVEVYKRQQDDSETVSKFKLQEIDLDDSEKEIYAKQIKTQAKLPTSLKTKSTVVSLKDHEIIDEGFFSSNYAAFYIEVKKLGKKVRRRPSDFSWLSKILEREFPGTYVPPVYNTSEKNYDEGTIVEQAIVFKAFLDDLLNHPEIRRSIALEAFLSLPVTEFNQKKKQLDKFFIRKPIKTLITKRNIEHYKKDMPALNEFFSNTGKSTIKISSNLKNFYHSYQDYLTKSQENVDKICKLSKDLLYAMNTTQLIMGQIGDAFSELHQVNLDYNEKCNFGKDTVKEKLFFCLQNAFSCWSETTNNQLSYIDIHLNKFFEYWKAELDQMEDLVKTRNVICSEYYKHKMELNDKKQKSLVSGDQHNIVINKSLAAKACLDPKDIKGETKLLKKFMLPKQTRVIRDLADYFGLFNNKIFEQQQRYSCWRNKKAIKNFTDFAGKQVKLVTQSHLIWAEITSHLSDYSKRVDERLQCLASFIKKIRFRNCLKKISSEKLVEIENSIQ